MTHAFSCTPESRSEVLHDGDTASIAPSTPISVRDDMEVLMSDGRLPRTTSLQRRRNKLTMVSSYLVLAHLKSALLHDSWLHPPRLGGATRHGLERAAWNMASLSVRGLGIFCIPPAPVASQA